MGQQAYFDLSPGRVLTRNYRVDRLLGTRWEGEVYLVNERLTVAHRAAKLFYPDLTRRTGRRVTMLKSSNACGTARW